MSNVSHLILDYNPVAQKHINSASILKPIIVWLALKKLVHGLQISSAEHHQTLQTYRDIIVNSDNQLTTNLVSNTLPLKEITEELNKIIGDRTDPLTIPETWGRFRLTAGTVFLLYKALVEENTPESEQVLGWMQEVAASQRFGVSKDYSMKAGWDLTANSQLVLLIVKIDKASVKVLTATSDFLNNVDIEKWEELETSDSDTLISFHTKFFTQELKTFHALSK